MNSQFLKGESFLYMIGLLQLIYKQLDTFMKVMVYYTNSKYPPSHTPSTDGFLLFFPEHSSELTSSPPSTTNWSIAIFLVSNSTLYLCLFPDMVRY